MPTRTAAALVARGGRPADLAQATPPPHPPPHAPPPTTLPETQPRHRRLPLHQRAATPRRPAPAPRPGTQELRRVSSYMRRDGKSSPPPALVELCPAGPRGGGEGGGRKGGEGLAAEDLGFPPDPDPHPVPGSSSPNADRTMISPHEQDDGEPISVGEAKKRKQFASSLHDRQGAAKKKMETALQGYYSSAYRCSPHRLPAILRDLSPQQKSYVREIGFGSLLDMVECKLDKLLTLWLVFKVDCDRGVIQIGGQGQRPIEIKPLVKSILGIPNGPLKVETGSGVDKRRRNLLFTRQENIKTVTDAVTYMYTETDKDKFCSIFMLVILCLYLAPNMTSNISISYLGAVSKEDQINQMDWCGFVADYLIQGIRHYQDSDNEHTQIKGCVHILTLIYTDYVKHKALKIDKGLPRITQVTTKHIKLLCDNDTFELLVIPEDGDHQTLALEGVGNNLDDMMAYLFGSIRELESLKSLSDTMAAYATKYLSLVQQLKESKNTVNAKVCCTDLIQGLVLIQQIRKSWN